MINTNHVTIPTAFFTRPEYSDLTYIYALTDGLTPFYVGSSWDTTSRYLTHLAGITVDNKAKVLELQAQGIQPTMVLLDVTVKQHRLPLEGYWIDRLSQKHQLCNTSRYLNHTADFKANPLDYYSLSHGNLASYVGSPLALSEQLKKKKVA